ncbi:MAG: PEP-CTERM sorting domain-containing protein [Phycisphaerales bacterium JB041]
MSLQSRIGIVIVSALVGAHSARVSAQAEFVPLGDLDGGAFFSLGVNVSPDGSAVGGLATDGSGTVAFRWTASDGMVSLGDLAGGAVYAGAYAVAGYGCGLAGGGTSSNGLEAFRWSEDAGMVPLGDLPGGGFTSLIYASSNDGSVLVGLGTDALDQRAIRWTRAGGMEPLTLFSGETYSDAFDCSADGSVITGVVGDAVGSQAYRWTEASGKVGLGDLAGGALSSAGSAISDDGDTIVGFASIDTGTVAFVWTDATGMVSAGRLQESDAAELWGVNSDGTVAVGYSGAVATIWTPQNGLRSLQTVLTTQYGLGGALAGWTLESANAVSSDGRVIVGSGTNPNGDSEAWLVRLPEPCPGDFNGDGTVNTLDVLAFLNAWTAGCP